MNQNGKAKSYKTTTVIDPISSPNPTSSKNEEQNAVGFVTGLPAGAGTSQLVTPKNRVRS